MQENPYHRVAYPTVPQRVTHPDRLAAVASLFGMRPAPVNRCRTLEIGCGDAANLLPMAYGLPESSFTGVDLASEPVTRARGQAEALGLANLTLHAMDLAEIGPEFGEFDYIIAHGLYSWTPPATRDALLAVCRERLAPAGTAFISYNVYPGRHARQMLREMMLFHTRSAPDGAAKVEEAKSFLLWLGEKSTAREVWQPLLKRESGRLLDGSEGGFYHDDLAPVNDPVYFWQFAEHAARHRLQYVGDAEFHQMFDQLRILAGREMSFLEREQYLDFLKLRSFRQTILCRAEVPLDRRPMPEQMERFLFSAPAHLDGGQWHGAHGVELSAGQQEADRVAQALGDAYPLPLPFDDLLPYANSRANLRAILFGMATHGFVGLHVYDFPCEETVTERPRSSRLARFQAQTSQRVVNACHDMVELDEIGRRLLLLLDGARDHAAIARDLAATADAPPEPEIIRTLNGSLRWMARMALLEG